MNLKNFELEVKLRGYKVQRYMFGTRQAYFDLSKGGIFIAVPRHKVISTDKEQLMKEILELYEILKVRKYGN